MTTHTKITKLFKLSKFNNSGPRELVKTIQNEQNKQIRPKQMEKKAGPKGN